MLCGNEESSGVVVGLPKRLPRRAWHAAVDKPLRHRILHSICADAASVGATPNVKRTMMMLEYIVFHSCKSKAEYENIEQSKQAMRLHVARAMKVLGAMRSGSAGARSRQDIAAGVAMDGQRPRSNSAGNNTFVDGKPLPPSHSPPHSPACPPRHPTLGRSISIDELDSITKHADGPEAMATSPTCTPIAMERADSTLVVKAVPMERSHSTSPSFGPSSGPSSPTSTEGKSGPEQWRLDFVRAVKLAVVVDKSGHKQDEDSCAGEFRAPSEEPESKSARQAARISRDHSDLFRPVDSEVPPPGPAVLENLPIESSATKAIERLVQQRMRGAKCVEVQRVHNPFQWRRYKAEYENFVDSGINPRQALVWHGTRSADPCAIASSTDGLDARLSERSNLMFGRGLYFAESPLYSTHFANVVMGPRRRDNRVLCRMLLCQVLEGTSSDLGTTPHTSLRKPPPGFTSVRGRTHHAGGSELLTVYSNAQCYTGYVVTISLPIPVRRAPVSGPAVPRPVLPVVIAQAGKQRQHLHPQTSQFEHLRLQRHHHRGYNTESGFKPGFKPGF